MTTVALQHLHIRTLEAGANEVCEHCHKPASKLSTIRGLKTKFCECCISRITDGISDGQDTISGYLAHKHAVDALGRDWGVR